MFIQKKGNSSYMVIQNWNIRFDEETTAQLLSYFRKISLFSDIEPLSVVGIEDDSNSEVEVHFDGVILKIDNDDVFIISNDDIERTVTILEDSSNDSEVIF